jgi:hypothetical protein
VAPAVGSEQSRNGVLLSSVDVKHLPQVANDGAVVGVAGHQRVHVFPPAPADFRLGDRGPARLILDFDVGEELMGYRVQEDRIIVDAMRLELGFELWPDRAMTAFVFGLLAGVDGHDECFSNHKKPKGALGPARYFFVGGGGAAAAGGSEAFSFSKSPFADASGANLMP